MTFDWGGTDSWTGRVDWLDTIVEGRCVAGGMGGCDNGEGGVWGGVDFGGLGTGMGAAKPCWALEA